MGFPIRKAAGRNHLGRVALIGVMLGGGLLYAGISQAQEIGVTDQAERTAELVAASGGPASPARLIPFEADKAAAVEQRDDDVADVDDGSAPKATPATDARASAEKANVGQVAAAGAAGGRR